jgi:hypothetical protein
MGRILLFIALATAVVALLVGAGAPLASSDGFTWDAPAKTPPSKTDGWSWH